jgi:hypothetical protein
VDGVAVILALASAATWGLADFAGGLVSRRLPTLTVTVISQSVGFATVLLVWSLRGGGLDERSFALGLLAGIGGVAASPRSTRRSRWGR